MMIDLIFAALIVYALFKGYQKGMILAIFSIIAFIIGLAAAIKLSAILASYLETSVNVSARWIPFIAFILVFFVVVLLVRLGAKLIEKTFQMAMLGWLNRLGGILFYSILFTIILSIFIFYIEKLQLIKPETIQESITYTFIQPWGPYVINGFGKLIPIFKDMFTELENFFNIISNKLSH